MIFQYATSQFPAGGSRKVDELLECGYHKVKGNLTTFITIWHGLEIMTALTASTKTSIICMVKVGSSSSSSSNDYLLGVWSRLPYSIKREHCSCFNGNEAVLAGEGEHEGEDVSKSSTPLWMMGQEHGCLVPVRDRADWWHQGNGEAIIWWGSAFLSECGTRQDIWPPCTPFPLSSTPNPDMSFSWIDIYI